MTDMVRLNDEEEKISFERDGFTHLRSCVDPDWAFRLKVSFINIMAQFSDSHIAIEDIGENVDSVLDGLFNEITERNVALRENVFKVFSKNMMILNIPFQKKIASALKNLGVAVPTLTAFGVLAMEPNRERFLFHPHQDLHNHISHRTINMWVPLTSGESIGGMGIVKGEHIKGPMPHSVASDGQLELSETQFDRTNSVLLENVPVGDAVLFDTQVVHWSILNRSDKIRWTVYLHAADGANTPHLTDRVFSFDPSKYIDVRKNEERIKAALGEISI